jgi:membrane fusion protein, multidrug efflux system
MTHHPSSLKVERPISESEAAQQFQAPGDGSGLAAASSAQNRTESAPQVEASVQPGPPPVAPPSATAAPAKGRLRRVLMAAAGVAALGAGAHFGWDYWTVGRFHVSTDDAYVQADNTTIAPKVSGYLAEVLVGDNEAVKTGQVLARIDDRDYRVALDQAKADVAAAQAAAASKQAAIDAQQSAIDVANATIQVDQASETFAEQENKRYSDLATSGFGSLQNAQQAAARIAGSRASVMRDRAALNSAIKQLALQKADLTQAEAVLAHNEAVRSQAELNLGYSAIVSPVDGVVGNRTLRVGQYVQAGTQLMSVVPSAEAYIVANYKETQLTDVRRGQPVNIEVDMFPGRVFHGHVDSLAPASGQTFALLPPDNATGNFTKVVQRIPVKIVLDRDSTGSGDLRPGMSVTPSIDTKAQPTGLAVVSAAKTARQD